MIQRITTDRESDYLIVNQYLRHLIPARALRSAFDFGLIDLLGQTGVMSSCQLAAKLTLDEQAIDILLATLAAADVVEHLPSRDDAWQLTVEFRHALRFRDLLEAKLDHALCVVPDLTDRFEQLLIDPEDFARNAETSGLSDYARCVSVTAANIAEVRRWMRFSTAMTRYETEACLRRFPFYQHRRMVDVGGGSGEFALQVCRRHPELTAVVMELPVVCHIGRQYVAARRWGTEANRIEFVEADALRSSLPVGADLICFKSIFHEWPDKTAQQLIRGALNQLPVGGRLLVYERAPIPVGPLLNQFHLLPMLLHFRRFRNPDFYTSLMQDAGFDVDVQRFNLDMPFMIVSARKRNLQSPRH